MKTSFDLSGSQHTRALLRLTTSLELSAFMYPSMSYFEVSLYVGRWCSMIRLAVVSNETHVALVFWYSVGAWTSRYAFPSLLLPRRRLHIGSAEALMVPMPASSLHIPTCRWRAVFGHRVCSLCAAFIRIWVRCIGFTSCTVLNLDIHSLLMTSRSGYRFVVPHLPFHTGSSGSICRHVVQTCQSAII